MKIRFNLVALFLFLSCSHHIETNKFETNEFSIIYPEKLVFNDGNEEGAVFILKSTPTSPDDVFIENINLVTQEVNEVEFVEFANQTVSKIEGFAEVEKSEIININTINCLRIVFSMKQNNLDLKFIQHYLIKGNKMYLLTFSSESKFYNDYYEEMNNVLMSFKLK
ncbi:hypothetical protein HX004_13810 [Myroides sp. 1354]|uniref:hypothetical protein n=1 Tax=unclassified Myroides TaxID=2642485 RepID=UPI0025765EF9|nr:MULTISPECIES: hypothetical protein [unclassified Myroides]MDM1044458.1 hypothetical protein [Myroides sp. R163-1]MDM1056840.1 hypothetical protein [Myroides sp. 1354]MDM1069889.1 hypothetical protein [Myroides sp. 1372]